MRGASLRALRSLKIDQQKPFQMSVWHRRPLCLHLTGQGQIRLRVDELPFSLTASLKTLAAKKLRRDLPVDTG